MICTMCENEARHLNVLDNETMVCDACLLSFFDKCAKCGGLWDLFKVKFFTLKDGRLICEHCREGFDDDEIVFDD